MKRNSVMAIYLGFCLATGCASTGSLNEPRVGRASTDWPLPLRKSYFEKAKAVVEGSTTLVNGEAYQDRAMQQHYKNFESHSAARISRDAEKYGNKVASGIYVPTIIGMTIGLAAGAIWAASDISSYINPPSNTARKPYVADYSGNMLVGAGIGIGVLGLTISLPLSLAHGGKSRAAREEAAQVFNSDLEHSLGLNIDASGIDTP